MTELRELEELKKKVAEAEKKKAEKEGKVQQIMSGIKKIVGKEVTIDEAEEYHSAEIEKVDRKETRAQKRMNDLKEKANVWGI